MKKYKVFISPRAISDIQNAINYYNSKQDKLGNKFYNDLKKQIASLVNLPFSRAIRYDDVRFAVINKFPYAIHYSIEDGSVHVHAVISMYLNPETNWK